MLFIYLFYDYVTYNLQIKNTSSLIFTKDNNCYIHTRTSKPRRFQINFLFNLGQSIDGNSRVSGDCDINAKRVSAIFIYKS